MSLKGAVHGLLCVTVVITLFNIYIAKRLIQHFMKYNINVLGETSQTIPSKTTNQSHYLFTKFQGRLGNNMFEYASSQAIALRNDLVPLYDTTCAIFKIFNIPKLDSSRKACKDCKNMTYPPDKIFLSAYLYDRGTELLGNISKSKNVNVVLYGFWHSWRYFEDIKDKIKSIFQIKSEIKDKALKFLLQNTPVKWINITFVYVGVHIRLTDRKQEWNINYLKKAISYYTEQFKNIQFVVCSDVIKQAKKIFPKGNYEVLYSINSRETDLAILASCNHSIITVGTFGWWGAWLAGGQVVYYNGFPPLRPKYFTRKQVQNDYYLPQWHPI